MYMPAVSVRVMKPCSGYTLHTRAGNHKLDWFPQQPYLAGLRTKVTQTRLSFKQCPFSVDIFTNAYSKTSSILDVMQELLLKALWLIA